MPLTGHWTEVTRGLRQLVIRIQPFAPFTYRGLVEFLVQVEDELDHLGDQPLERQHTANQLIFDLLIEPVHQSLPNTIADQVHKEHHLMRTYAQDEPEAMRYGYVTTLWVSRVYACRTVYRDGF